MLLVFDTHPVQYRAPLFREVERCRPGCMEVVYASDCSVRGHLDAGFGVHVQWDVPLLAGYVSHVLRAERGTPLEGFRSLTGRGVRELIRARRPRAVLLTSFAYEYSWAVVGEARRLGVPIWIRQETQDEAFVRSRAKSWIRSWCYRLLYRLVDHAFYIGRLNRQHLLRHGLSADRLSRSPYCVPDPLRDLGLDRKQELRSAVRARHGVPDDAVLVMFSGKLIPKKSPEILLDAVGRSSRDARRPLHLLYVGTGELEPVLRLQAQRAPMPVGFAGFINQSELPAYYLGADVLVLPSRRLGETWGLVVNEALLAGCAVVLSSAVGCAAEFGDWDRCRVFPEGDGIACAQALAAVAACPRSFNWATEAMRDYSVEQAAKAIAQRLD